MRGVCAGPSGLCTWPRGSWLHQQAAKIQWIKERPPVHDQVAMEASVRMRLAGQAWRARCRRAAHMSMCASELRADEGQRPPKL